MNPGDVPIVYRAMASKSMSQQAALIQAAKAVHRLPVQQGSAKLLPDPLSLPLLGVTICIVLMV